jgi:hypothetical protein
MAFCPLSPWDVKEKVWGLALRENEARGPTTQDVKLASIIG